MHCPSCDALNPDNAKWCALCLTRFDPQEPEGNSGPVVQAGDGGLPTVRVDPPEVEEAWGAVARSADVVHAGPIRSKAEVVTWICHSCTHENPMKENSCAVCGASFFDAFKPRDVTVGPAKDPTLAALLSVVPGAGHLYLGRVAEGVTRLLLALWWLMFALLFPSSTPALLGVRVLFIIASIGLVMVSIYDANRAAVDPKAAPLLDRRIVLWAALALGMMMMIGTVATSLSAAR